MKKGRKISLFVICVLIIVVEDTYSQVTIGSGIAPVRAGMLDIKDQEPDADNVTSKSGGIVLPRVELMNLSTLEPFMETSIVDYDKEKKIHTGMLVYNMTNTSSITPGLYFWDGTKWNILLSSSSPNNGSDPDPSPNVILASKSTPTNPNSVDALKLTNTYIVPSGKIIEIPLIKAYAVWMQKLNLSEEDLDGAISVELLWEDNRDLITNVALWGGDKREKSLMRVSTNKGDEGNAVVVMKVRGVVRWSWHIWVTSYDPTKTENQRTIKGLSSMDRNLGALNTVAGDILSQGLLYQWGRKDPFVNASTTTGTTECRLYKSDGKTNISYAEVSSESNLINSVLNPLTFYTSNSENKDWITNKTRKDDHLWNNVDNTKGIYDPCPEGWRVPGSGENGNSLWSGATGLNSMFDPGYGIYLNTNSYFPAAGSRSGSSGALTNVGTMGGQWSRSPFYSAAFSLYFYNYFTQISGEDITRASALSVRCVKE